MRLARLSMALFALTPSFADTHTLDKEKGAVTIETEAKHGIELPTVSAAHDSVEMTAVILTQSSVRRLFGKEIATYAEVQLSALKGQKN